jgi:membrane protein insertase Oxa1/YidC/SpoIIIJ
MSSILLAFASRLAISATLTVLFFLFLPLGLVIGWALPYVLNWVQTWLPRRHLA